MNTEPPTKQRTWFEGLLYSLISFAGGFAMLAADNPNLKAYVPFVALAGLVATAIKAFMSTTVSRMASDDTSEQSHTTTTTSSIMTLPAQGSTPVLFADSEALAPEEVQPKQAVNFSQPEPIRREAPDGSWFPSKEPTGAAATTARFNNLAQAGQAPIIPQVDSHEERVGDTVIHVMEAPRVGEEPLEAARKSDLVMQLEQALAQAKARGL